MKFGRYKKLITINDPIHDFSGNLPVLCMVIDFKRVLFGIYFFLTIKCTDRFDQ